MKITNKGPNPMPSAETTKSAKAGAPDSMLGGAKARSAATAGLDGQSSRVDLSSRSQQMAKAKEIATPSDDIDEAKVARLQKMIDSGSYKIDADAIADRLLDEHSKMP